MHPAPSVIIFTTFSGIGFGLLAWLGMGYPSVTGWVAFAFFAIAFALSVGGLLASTFHLGHPERAIKAFSQWRSSWLSREGCCAVAALIVMGIYAIGAIFLGTRWPVLGWIGAGLSVLTVYTTSMIYAQLKTVPHWHTIATPALFLSLMAAGGALMAGQVQVAVWLLALSAAVQLIYWHHGTNAMAGAGTSVGSATGLGARGSVRSFEPPHTGSNYLLHEFVYTVGRRHALKLRVIAMILGYAVPVALLCLPFSHIFALIAVLSHVAGILVARWLFFAQAQHVVSLYYPARSPTEQTI